MVEIRKLNHLQREDLHIMDGYVSTDRYQVSKSETADEFCFILLRKLLCRSNLQCLFFTEQVRIPAYTEMTH